MTAKRSPELKAAISACRPGLIGIVVLTGVLALMPLVLAIYALLLFDTALASRSGGTLAGILIMVGIAIAMQAFLAHLRDRLFAQVGEAITLDIDRRVDAAVARSIETAPSPGDGLQAARDLDAVRHFLSGRAAAAFADIPAAAFLLLVMTLFHGLLALTLLVAGAVMIALLVLTLRHGIAPAREETAAVAERNASIELGFRHAELIRVLGMGARAAAARAFMLGQMKTAEQRAAAAVAGYANAAAGVRLAALAALLAVGGWLAIQDRASVGVIVAAALLGTRALRPIEEAIGHGRSFALARQGWRRIDAMLVAVPPVAPPLPLPAPTQRLEVEGVTLAIAETRRVVLRNVGFSLSAGDALAVIGPSATGKSALLRALVGGLRPAAGTIRFDGGAIDQWDGESLGRHIGYLPQGIELFAGTVAQNIARFDAAATADQVIAAATAANVHDLIVRLPNGYDTELGPGGARLSMGERQRVALARALYGDPFLIVLDDPATYADGVGQTGLARAIAAVRKRGGIVVSAGAAPATVDPANLVLVLRDGAVQDYGPKADVRARLDQARGRGKPIVTAPAPPPPAAEETP